jgi:broad specificity phosphatase PhoE
MHDHDLKRLRRLHLRYDRLMPDCTAFLVRHGEVSNPDHLVYADLPGFGLSARGTRQAGSAADHLRVEPIRAVVSSPLRRAWETAGIIALALGITPVGDGDLTEWRLSSRWAGTVWEDLPDRFPGELEAYLDHPEALPFSPESLTEVAARTARSIERWCLRVSGPVVFVAHQDPIQAARLALTGRDLTSLPQDKPGHGGIVELRAATGTWSEVAHWEPPQGPAFPPRV